MVTTFYMTTLEPLNNGQVGTSTLVHYSEVILYWGVWSKSLIFVSLSAVADSM